MRGQLQWLHLIAVNANNQPLPGRFLQLVDQEGRGYRAIQTNSNGELLSLVPVMVERLQAIVEGFEDATVIRTTGPILVTFYERE